MTIKGEFIPLSLLVHSLTHNQRLYFLYRKASETGSTGAELRFEWFKRSLSNQELERFEAILGSRKNKARPKRVA